MDCSDLMAQLNEAGSELLNAEGLYPVLNYGLEGEDDVSEEYARFSNVDNGRPFTPSLTMEDRKSPPPLPSEREEVFHRAGEDFVGTMEFARNAIGSTLYSFEHRRPDIFLDDDDRFWQHHATATLWLNIASDRIRDYFVMARFGVTSKEYGKQNEKNGIYTRPFRMHDQGETPNAKSTALKLVSVAEKLGKLRRCPFCGQRVSEVS